MARCCSLTGVARSLKGMRKGARMQAVLKDGRLPVAG